jgi:hypothetical protein
MKSDESRLRSAALLQTVLICGVVEALVLVVLHYWTNSWGGAVVLSIVALGPLSLWFARPLYRYLLQAR